ncbi:uncharacterized protein PGTG_22790 [Puccinia graminis f. sp. tritici CRL 75-36-700-3]|uniref:CCHC-type domain-containing protein n=1 Tax=Puccinia graminis f. sp. tritici (strain CRL 75-36-700-3 / race SCCL) TaxID=418459 RepID=H6QVL9_PUCGT|nr:uncharacterized protein PGTG_22790 [Puccinia graminis f. sp. tritici CRL 75-36-700-3]EHS63341.1 hypothetical protein PGTG_22790 [Puccinia graminis f. sp. tritici CRL 75-36-700-3]
MSLPFSTPDLEDGFAPSTPLKNRPFAPPSAFNWTAETSVPPPPKLDKGKGPAHQLRDPTDEDYDSDNPTPQKQPNPPRPSVSGYGIHNTQNMGEPVFNRQHQPPVNPQPIHQQPIYQPTPKIIKEPGLFYNGENFSRFLQRFERAAHAFGATDYDKALQIGRFMKTEELRLQLEAMEGYKTYDWAKLQEEMNNIWGDLDNNILYTTNDLVKVAEEYGKNGGIRTHKQYKSYLTKFTTILNYLVTNQHLHKKEDASILFMQAFAPESQMNVKQTLVGYDLIPKAPDGSTLPPLWAHLIKAVDMEVQAIEPGNFNVTNFSESNRLMQKKLDLQKGDGQRRERMIAEAPTGKPAVGKTVEDLSREIASLQQQLKSILPVSYNQPGTSDKQEFSRGNPRPSTPLYESLVCYYCRKEGHSTTRCPELAKDESEGLVKRQGKDWYLPNGQHIPWNPSRPIQSVVATASADPQILEAARRLVESRNTTGAATEPTPTMKSSVQTIHWAPPELGAQNFLKNQAITRSEAQRGRRSVRIQEPREDRMEVDQEDKVADIANDSPRTTPKTTWVREKTPARNQSANPEDILLQELDHMKIPTTFSQLTTISPTYTEKVIAKLQERLPGKSSATYVATPSTKAAAAMTTTVEEEDTSDPCYYSCALGYVTAEVGGAKVDFMVDSGSMVNVIPRTVAEDLDLELVQVDIPMKGVGGARCDLNGVAENCYIGIGRFAGPAHLFVSPKAQDCILGRPFLFDYGCTLEYHETGETLSFQGTKGRRVSVPLARIGQGRGWDNRKDLSTNTIKPVQKQEKTGEENRMFKKKSTQPFL